jgi:hypothetical protein
MEKKIFKNLLGEVMAQNEFSKKGNYYYHNGKDCDCVIGLQKSNFSNGYYISVGFILKGSNQITDKLTDANGDIRARFSYIDGERENDLFDLDKLVDNDEQTIREILLTNIKKLIKPAMEPDGLKKLLAENPILLYQTNLATKKILGFE